MIINIYYLSRVLRVRVGSSWAGVSGSLRLGEGPWGLKAGLEGPACCDPVLCRDCDYSCRVTSAGKCSV